VLGEIVASAKRGEIRIETSAPPEVAAELEVLLKLPVETAMSNLGRKGLLAA
jgi:hypothetical protein